MTARRKSYSVEYKKQIVEECENANLSKFCEEKKLSPRLVRKWRASKEELDRRMEEGNAKKRKCGAGRRPLFLELEDVVLDWILNRRASCLVVRRAEIQAFALESAPQLDISDEVFKASSHWLSDFMKRKELSLRRSTTLFKLEDNEIIERALTFKDFVDKIDLSRYESSNVIAMDETAVFLGQGPESTIEKKGASTIYVPATGYESARITCVLAIRLDGTIAKGKKEDVKFHSGVYVMETEKAWCTQAVIRKWVDLMLPQVARNGKRGLIVWDSASTHLAKEMKNFLARRGVDQIMIPAGMTGYLQTLDLAINKPFKDYIRGELREYVEHRMRRNQRGNFVKPSIAETVFWVRNAWGKISEACVLNALRAGYLDRTSTFAESYIAKHERLGDLVIREDYLRRTQATLRNMHIFDDVPEDDDLEIIE